ncbi:MAG: glucosidase, partial [Synechococcaceae cyanobacterium]|nr:glucosidase [Synechococcaceae cyanobacterium]
MAHPSEARRMAERDHGGVPWGLWGSYLSDRQWGTVREDYSADGDAWTSFPHDHARSRTYRWGEDGLLGLCDQQCRMCFSVALWNGVDPILKERPFGLGNPEGNHGEDLKDYFFHLANTPTHSFMRGLYKYPQREFPYQHLIEENGRRGRDQPEYELIDTGIFADNRYFDVTVEYAKATPEDLLIRVRVVNRGPDPAPLTLLPTLWLRNTWSWGYPDEEPRSLRPLLSSRQMDDGPAAETAAILSDPIPHLGVYRLDCREPGSWIFTDNETNSQRLWGQPNATAFQKDGFHRYIVDGEAAAINPAHHGSKAARLLQHRLEPGEEWVVELRLRSQQAVEQHGDAPIFGPDFDALMAEREQEWLAFFEHRIPGLSEDDRRIHLSGAAGLLWCKKYYGWSVLRWLEGDPTAPTPPAARWNTP